MHACVSVTHSGVSYHRHRSLLAGMLSVEANVAEIFGHVFEGCPRGLVVSHRNHVSYVKFLSDRELLLAL